LRCQHNGGVVHPEIWVGGQVEAINSTGVGFKQLRGVYRPQVIVKYRQPTRLQYLCNVTPSNSFPIQRFTLKPKYQSQVIRTSN
jgi:hypothetical protein